MTRKRAIRISAIWLSRHSFWIAVLWMAAWAGSFVASVAYGDTGDGVYLSSRACVPGESWNLGAPGGANAAQGAIPSGSIPSEYQDEFTSFLGDSRNPEKAIRAFSEAVSLRRSARTADPAQGAVAKVFAEYWISRAFYAMGLPHLAHEGFQSIARNVPEQGLGTLGIRAAALDCLLRIRERHPSLEVPESALSFLVSSLGPRLGLGPGPGPGLGVGSGLASTLAAGIPPREAKYLRPIVLEAALSGVQARVADERADPARLQANVQALLDLLKGGGPYEDLARGIWAAGQGRHRDTVRFLSRFFADGVPSPLERYQDTAHLLSARARYTLGGYDAAGNELKRVAKSSNALAESLEELSWADLMNERYPEAIGTAMNLDGGGLLHTYAPEAPMVSAMAMNELCQYPDAVREIAVFRRDYKQSYAWLSSWVSTQSGSPAAVARLYEQAVRFIERKSDLPDRVAGEWVRTPLFIASQDEVNTLFDERDFLSKVGGIASREQRVMALRILKDARELKPDYLVARMKLKAGEQLPSSIRERLASLKREVIHWRRFRRSAPVWMAIARRFRGTIVPTQARLVARINTSIRDLNVRMLTQLDEISENIQLIEVEIYNGASQDIIWKNAHPDYRQIAQQMRDAREAVVRSKTWDWGREPAGSGEAEEIWEDELGSFKANLFDNCSSKDKYLAIRMKRTR